MSYCRWSCDNYASDVYVYEDVSGGFTVHVAGSRYVGPIPDPGLLPFKGSADELKAWVERHREQGAALRAAGTAPIGLPLDGKSFTVDTPGEMVELLDRMRELGYRVPDHAMEALRFEAAKE